MKKTEFSQWQEQLLKCSERRNIMVSGIGIGMSGNIDDLARKFMLDNGYKFTEFGRNQALCDLEAMDTSDYDPEFIVALKTAIATVSLKEKNDGK